MSNCPGVVGIDVAGDEGHLEEGKSAMFEQVTHKISFWQNQPIWYI